MDTDEFDHDADFDIEAFFDDFDLDEILVEDQVQVSSAADNSSTSASGATSLPPSASGTDVNPPTTDQTTATATRSTQPKRSRPRIQKKRIPRPQSTFTLEEAQANSEVYLMDCVRAVDEDEIICDPTFENSPVVKNFAQQCKRATSEQIASALVHFATVLTLLWPSLKAAGKHSIETCRRQAIYSTFFQIRISLPFRQALKKTFQILSGMPNVPNLFSQMFARILHEKLTILHEKVEAPEMQSTRSTLTKFEENALRYTGGYVVFKVSKKVKPKYMEDMDKIVSNMKAGHGKETKLSYTKEWLEVQNRGGLTLINDVSFLFFKKLEQVVRRTLPNTTEELIHVDLRVTTAQAALQDRDLLGYWDQIAHNSVDERTSLIFLQLFVDFFIQVRNRALARQVIEKFKILDKSNQKGAKGLRSGLKRQEASESST